MIRLKYILFLMILEPLVFSSPSAAIIGRRGELDLGALLSPEEVSAFCSLHEPAIKEVYPVTGSPIWFFKPAPEGRLVCYIDQTDEIFQRDNMSYLKQQNRCVRFPKDGGVPVEFLIPGEVDPVISPDGRVLVIPKMHGSTPGSIQIYAMEGLSQDSAPLVDDSEMDGAYQSVGLLKETPPSKNPLHRTYRVIIDSLEGSSGSQKLLLRDYEMTSESNNPKGIAPTVHLGSVREICPNLFAPGTYYRLPMLSKDGTELSMLNLTTGTTQIFKIESDNNCNLVEDLEIPTGKVDFSSDGRRLVFHVGLGYTPSYWFSQPAGTNRLAVVLYDRDKKSFQSLANSPGAGNSYYPNFFIDDGKEMIIFLRQSISEQGDNVYGFVVAHPKQGARVDLRSSCEELPVFHAIETLWLNICKGPFALSGDVEVAPFFVASLDRKNCRKVIEKVWEPFAEALPASEQVLKDTKIEDVLALCPGYFQGRKKVAPAVPQAPPSPPSALDGGSEKLTAGQVFSNNCAYCHSQGSNFIPFSDSEALKVWSSKIKEKVSAGEMPPQGMNPLTAAEKVAVLEGSF